MSVFSQLTPEQLDAVWTEFLTSYGDIKPVFSKKEQMLVKYNLLLLIDLDGNTDQLPNAFIIYKKTPFGNKLALTGTDRAKPSTSAIVKKKLELLNNSSEHWYVEASGRPAEILKFKGISPIKDKTIIEKVLRPSAPDLEYAEDFEETGNYSRDITGVGRHTKQLYGNPKV